MQYFGGKARHAKWLADNILPISKRRRLIEPFCGGLSATVALQPAIASDISPSLICLYKAIRAGWKPPHFVSEKTFIEVKAINDPTDPMTAFCRFGCSFGGNFFGGYANGTPGKSYPVGGSYAKTSSLSIVNKISAIDTTFLFCLSYDELEIKPNDVIYCDPPYSGAAHGYDAPKWNAPIFWEWARKCADLGAIVIISEFNAPDDIELIAEKDASSNIQGANTTRKKEKLYRIG